MSTTTRIALAQINTTVGDLEGNVERVRHGMRRAEEIGADILLFPELTISGYPPEDLLLKKRFVAENKAWLQKLAQENERLITIVGFVDNQAPGIQNAAAVLQSGRVAAVAHKICLPNYSVFDEKRYFRPGRQPLVFERVRDAE